MSRRRGVDAGAAACSPTAEEENQPRAFPLPAFSVLNQVFFFCFFLKLQSTKRVEEKINHFSHFLPLLSFRHFSPRIKSESCWEAPTGGSKHHISVALA